MDELVRLITEDVLSWKEIAKRCRCGPRHVRRTAERLQIGRRSPEYIAKLEQEQREDRRIKQIATRMLKSGAHPGEVHEATGMTRDAVDCLIEQLSITVGARVAYVYSLSDPRTGDVRYVGSSLDPWYRIRAHRTNPSGKAVARWIAELRSHGEEPVLSIIEKGPVKTRFQRELHWIRFYSSQGHNLFNVVGVAK